MGHDLKVVHVGLGPIGKGIARLALETEGLRVVGAMDISSEIAGHDLGAVLGLREKLRIKVQGNFGNFIKKLKADVALLSTSSSLREIHHQLAALLGRGIHVVSTCEELICPAPASQAICRELDRIARKKKVTILGTGVNPGFAMDTLALMLTAPCAVVKRVSVTRVVDAATRRVPLQRRVGAGLTLSQFRHATTAGTVRHVGLVESAHLIASGLGWKLDRVDETIEPAIAPRDLDTAYVRVPAGCAAGIKQYARGYCRGELAISLDLQMYVGAESPRDHILIDGEPPIDMTIAGGVAGDQATPAIVINSIPKVLSAPPGLITMKELPVLHRFNPHEARNRPPKPKR
jgi:hypothetical protein